MDNFELPSGYTRRVTPLLDPPRDKVQHQIDAQWDVYQLASEFEQGVVIDVGCGGATKTKNFFHDRDEVVLVDYPGMIDSISWDAPNLRKIRVDLDRELMIPEVELESFVRKNALIICADVIEHLKDPRHLLRALAAMVLLNGNNLIMSTPDRSKLLEKGIGNPLGPPQCKRHAQEWTAEEFEKFMASEGLKGGDHYSLPAAKNSGDEFTQCWVFG
jgi:hypothetical protein